MVRPRPYVRSRPNVPARPCAPAAVMSTLRRRAPRAIQPTSNSRAVIAAARAPFRCPRRWVQSTHSPAKRRRDRRTSVTFMPNETSVLAPAPVTTKRVLALSPRSVRTNDFDFPWLAGRGRAGRRAGRRRPGPPGGRSRCAPRPARPPRGTAAGCGPAAPGRIRAKRGSEFAPAAGSATVLNAPQVRADVAQLVEHHLAKVRVAGSNPVVRSEGAYAGVAWPLWHSPFMAEWPSGLGKGLQSPVHGFDSRLRLPYLASLI